MSETISIPAKVIGGPHDGRTLNVEATVPINGVPTPPNRVILAAEMTFSLLSAGTPEDLFRRYAYDFVGFSGDGAVYHYTELGSGAGPVRPVSGETYDTDKETTA